MAPARRKRRLSILLAGGAALVIAAFVSVQLWDRSQPRWTILTGDNAKLIVQFNHDARENDDPVAAGKFLVWTPSARDIADAERQWTHEAQAISRVGGFASLHITPDKLVYGYDRQYAGYFSRGRRLIMLSAHDADLDRRMSNGDNESWRARAAINWDEPPTRFWIDYDPSTHAFGAPQPAWALTPGASPGASLPNPPDPVSRKT